MTPVAPMLCVPSTGASGRRPITLDSLQGTHLFDLKLDGLRAIIYWNGTSVRILNRSMVDITVLFPELDVNLGPVPFVLDGEIVTEDGTFTSVATRGKQSPFGAAVQRAMVKFPARFVAFDVLSLNTKDVTALPTTERRGLLHAMFEQPFGLGAHGPLEPVVWSTDPALMWGSVSQLGMEGLIAKRKDAPYHPGRRSPAWVKFKTVRTVTCVAVGYEKGEGARAHFGAMHLAMIGPDGPVTVGRVGTGFTQNEIAYLKARLDKEELFCVEIEALNRTAKDQLRFPVYRGVRTDLSPLDAKLDQLKQLPRC